MMDVKADVMNDQRQKPSRKKPTHFGHGVDDDQLILEPMNIQVTIYAMEGIRRHNLENPQCKSQRKGRFSNKNSAPKSTSSAPTTALVSIRGQVVKTLVPSAPLTFHQQRESERSARGIAFWQERVIGEETKSKDETLSSTFEISRKMKRQCFHRDARIDQISNYLPERIDLVVGVAKGSEIFPLGIASVAVSGDEEGESHANSPIMSLIGKTEKRNGKGRLNSGLLFDGDSHWYSLDSNAILRVGIRVLPRHNYIPRTMTKITSLTAAAVKTDDDMFIELNDENSLIAQFKESEQSSTASKTTERHDENESGCSTIFCGAMGFWPVPASPLPQHSSDSKIMEAKVLSHRNMSDVSGSTMRWQTRPEEKYVI